MSSKYYVVHPGSGTIVDLDECWIAEVKEDNDTANEALGEDDWETLLDNADRKWDGQYEVTLG